MAVKYTQTFKTYEDAAAEARRAQALAEALQQQAYQPIQMSAAAPVSYTEGLAKVLQAYMAGRQQSKAAEKEKEAKRVGREEFTSYVEALSPEKQTVNTGQLASMEMPIPYLENGRLEYKPAAPVLNQRAIPQFNAQGMTDFSQPMLMQIGGPLTPAQRRAKLLEGMGSGNPMVQAVAQAEYAKKPEVEEFGTTPVKGAGGKYYLASKSGRMVETNVGIPEEEMTPYQREQLGLEREKLGIERTKAQNAGALTVGDRFKNENTLRDEYLAQTAPFRTVQDAYTKIKSTSDNGPGDMSLLYAYVKLLDPGSVVRESEFATAAQSGSLGQRVQGAVEQVLSGKRLSPELRKSFLQEADNIYKSQKENAKQIGGKYRDLAKNYSLDPSRVVVEYGPAEMPAKDSVFLPQQPANPFAPQTSPFATPLPSRVSGYYK